MSIRLFISDSQEIFRQCLHTILKAEKNIEVVGSSGNGLINLELIEKTNPDIVITEIVLDGCNGIELTQRICGVSSRIKVIALTCQNNREYLIKMIQSGASGYLLKTCPYSELLSAISSVYKGNSYICPEISGSLLREYYTNKTVDCYDLIKNLSTREREVLHHIVQGKHLKEISHELIIDYETVKTHKKHIMEKLGIYNSAELMKVVLPFEMTPPAKS